MVNTFSDASRPALSRAMRLHPRGPASAHKAIIGAPHWVQAAGPVPAPGAPLATGRFCSCGCKSCKCKPGAGLTSRSRGTRRDAAPLQPSGLGMCRGFAQHRRAARPLPLRWAS